MRWRAIWRGVGTAGSGLCYLPEGSPDLVRVQLMALTGVIAGEEVRVIESRGAGAEVFHVALADLARWTPGRRRRPRVLASSPWLRILAREDARRLVGEDIRKALVRGCEFGLWSRATMRDVLGYCLFRLEGSGDRRSVARAQAPLDPFS